MKTSMRKNYLYNLVYHLSIMVLPLLVTPYIARVLGAENNGLYAFSSTIVCYFIMFGKLGLDNYGNRSIAFCREDITQRSRTFISIYAIQLCTSAVSVALYVGVVGVFFQQNAVLYKIQLIYVLSVLFDVSWFFYGMEKFRLTTLRSLLTRGLLIVSVFLFVHTENDLHIFTFLMAMSFLLEQIILFLFVFRYVRWVRVKLADIRVHFIPNLKLFIPLLALSVYNWMDKIMLGFIVDKESVAYYNYAESIINLPKGIITALGTVMLPKIANMVANNELEASRSAMGRSMKFIGFIACALCFGIAAMSPVFVPWFLGPQYMPTILLTLELAIVMIPMSIIDVIQTQYLIPFKLDHIYIRSVIAGAGVNLALNSGLIPLLGASGAVIATLGAQVTVAGYQLYKIRKAYPLRRLLKAFGPYLLSGAAMFAAVFSMQSLALSPVALMGLQLITGAAVYMGCVAAYTLVFGGGKQGLKAMYTDLLGGRRRGNTKGKDPR